ncbi:MAG: hypothetical protein HN431_09010 [Bacteroidetes bacterium]|nr:hypothetical protein [Bacteroidota bacterium]
MAFSLSKVGNGERITFSDKLILEILGDVINDEISIDGEAYRISSFISIGGEGSVQTYVWETIDISITQNNQTEFSINQDIDDPTNIFLIINHVLYRYGQNRDFHIVNQLLYWHGGFDLEPTDQMYLRFLTTI